MLCKGGTQLASALQSVQRCFTVSHSVTQVHHPPSSKPGYSLFDPLQLTPALLIFIDDIKFFLKVKNPFILNVVVFFVCFMVQFINTSLVHLESPALTLEIPDLQQKVFTQGSSFFQNS